MPLLYIDNTQVLTQSGAIARYFAKKHRLSGANDWEKIKVHEAVDAHHDLRAGLPLVERAGVRHWRSM